MADIAEIGFKAETSQLATASNSLNALKVSAASAETAAQKLTDQISKVNTISNVATGVIGNVSAAAAGASSKMATLAANTEKTSVAAREVSTGFSGLGSILGLAGGLVAGFIAAFSFGAIMRGLEETADRLDTIAKQARKMGESTAGFQSLSVAADMANADFGQLVNATKRMSITLNQLDRDGKGSSGIFHTLGISAGELLKLPLNERLETLGDRFRKLGANSEDLLPALAKLGDRQGALVSLFEDGGDQIRQAADMMQRFGGTITDLQASKIENMNDAFTSIKVAIGAAYTQVIAFIAPFLGPVFTAIAEGIGSVTKGFRDLLNGVSPLIPIMENVAIYLAIAFGPAAAVMIGAITGQVILLIANISSGLVSAIAIATEAMFAFALANPFTAIVLGIGVALAAIYYFRDEIKQALGIDVVAVARGAANDIIGAMIAAVEGSKAAWGSILPAIGDVVIQTANAVITTVQGMINTVIGAINTFVIGSVNSVSGLAGKVGVELGKVSEIGTVQLGTIGNQWAGSADALGSKVGAAIGTAMSTDWIGKMTAGASKVADVVANAAPKGAGFKFDSSKAPKKEKAASGKSDEEKYSDIVAGADRQIAKLQAEADAVGLTTLAADKLKYSTDLLNKADKAQIDLSPTQRAELLGKADDMAKLADQTTKTKETLGFLKDATRGFLADMKEGLKNGEGFWKSFQTAVSNVIDKIADKFLDLAVDSLFSSSTKGGGLSGIIGSIAGLFGGGGSPISLHAKGDIFGTPTAFGYGSNKLGVMGEKGPEAVVPLSRGSDGALGVQMYGGAQKSTGTTVNAPVNITNQYDMGGAIGLNEIQAQIKTASEKTTQTVRKSLSGWVGQINRDGAVV